MLKKIVKKKISFKILILILLLFISVFLILNFIELHNARKNFQRLEYTPNQILNITSFNYSFIDINEISNLSDYKIIDVREPEEFLRMHITGAENYRHGDIFRDESLLEKFKSENKTFLVYCFKNYYQNSSDGRSAIVAQFLLNNNISAKVINGGIKKVLEDRKDILIEDLNYELYDLSDYNIDYKENNCIMRFTNEYTELITKENHIVVNIGAGFLTSNEWDNFLYHSKKKECITKCLDRPTCFYANIFGMRLDNNGGKYMGFVLK